MRTTQHITTRPSRRLPVQRRLSAALTGPGLRHTAHRSTLGKANTTDVVAAGVGAATIVLALVALIAA